MISFVLLLGGVICLTVALLASYRRHVRQTSGFSADTRSRRILFVTAHPDDECMFFAPTILSVTRGGQYDVFLLCLSSAKKHSPESLFALKEALWRMPVCACYHFLKGNFYGQGRVRQKELVDSGRILGIRQSNIFVIDRRDLLDDPTVFWDKSVISRLVSEYVKEYYIDLIFTFDEYGVSGHANHKSIYEGIRHLLSGSDRPAGVEGYKLVSINLLRKYISVFELCISSCTSNLLFVSHWADIWRAQTAMYAHKSQFVWFRAIYVLFSRYMIINSYDPIVDSRTRSSQT